MTDENDETPKIIVDDDWKAEAQRDKEETDRETREMPGAGELPDPSFPEILQMIVLQAAVGLGGVQDPQTGQPIPPNLPVAKHYIDLLGLLQEKTVNNLDEQEKALLDGMLHELRMAFVQMTSASGQAPDEAPAAGE